MFVYHNVNPNGKRINDCVTRAIKNVSGLEYATIRKKLYHTARLLGCEKLCWTCYMFFIQEVLGYRAVNCDNMTVGEFAMTHTQGTYLVRIEGHLTSLVNGKIMDTWDCSNRLCTIAWKSI